MISRNRRRLRIALVTWAPFFAGAEMACERLALGLAEAGHDPLLIVGTEGHAAERYRAAGLRVQFVEQRFTDKLGWLRYRRSMKKLLNLLRAERPDIVHSNDLPTHQMASDAARRLKLPRICHHRWIFGRAAIDWFNKFGAERHLFVSRSLMEELCGDSPKLTACRRAVVYDGLQIPRLHTASEKIAIRETLAIPPNRFVILFAGQIIERKGIADLLNAWSMLTLQTRDNATLLIVGDDLENQGRYRCEMEKSAAGMPGDIRFLGFQADVASYLAAADVVVVPSHAEPLGNATLEAMSHGLPVVGSNVGGIPEMIDDERTGLLVPPRSPQAIADAIARIFNSEDYGAKLGERARERCSLKFDLRTHVSAVVEQYLSAIEESGRVLL